MGVKLKLRKYQQLDLTWLLKQPCSLYAADIGTGKSVVALKLLERRWKRGEVNRCLIVATPRIIEHTWPDEIRKWTDFDFATLHGPKWREALEEDVEIYLTTYDIFKKIAGDLYDDINMVIFDESHKLKSYKSKRFKNVKQFMNSFEFRLAMTGSPMPNSLEDLWSQVYLLDKGATLGKFITHYRRQYFNPHPAGFGWIPQEDAEERIFKELKWIMRHRKANKEAGLPKVIINDMFVTLPPSVFKQYKNMEREFIMDLEAGRVTAANAGSASSKLRQISNGFIYEGRGAKRVAHQLHHAKLEAIEELMDNLQGEPLLIAYSFQDDVAHFKKMGIPCLTGTSGSVARAMIKDWNDRKLKALAIHPASAGEGLNLQAGGHHLAWYGIPWDSAMYRQTIGRLARLGQKHTVIVHRIMAKHTIEKKISTVLQTKQVNQQKLFAAVTKGMTK